MLKGNNYERWHYVAGPNARRRARSVVHARRRPSTRPLAPHSGVPADTGHVVSSVSDRLPYRRAVTAVALGVLTVAAAVLVFGWMLDIAVVRSVFPGSQ